jgi:lipopolysaccharide/colanic/teichoic acid biosynthesis glycosyltransferase
MERAQERPPDVARAHEHLVRPRTRFRLAAKRGLDFVLALAMLVALAPMIVLALVLLLGDREGWIERRERLGRECRTLKLWRFRPLPGRLGRTLERAGVRELPLLLSVLSGRLSFVGPRALPPGAGALYTGPRRLMAPGLIGPALRGPPTPTRRPASTTPTSRSGRCWATCGCSRASAAAGRSRCAAKRREARPAGRRAAYEAR